MGACADAGTDQAPADETVAAVAEIPVTTASEDALEQFRQGRALSDVGRPLEAKAHFKQAIDLDPDFSYAHVNYPAFSAEEFREHLREAERALGGKSDGERMLVELAAAQWDNDSESALRLAEELVQAYPSSPRAWIRLANVQAGLNDHAEARASLQKALDLDPAMVLAHRIMGFSYLFNDPTDYEKALAHMQRTVELQPDEAKGYEAVGDAYRGLKDLERAREVYSMAVEKDPALGVASLKKGHINSFLGNFEEARADFDLGIETTPVENKANYANYRAFVHVHADDPSGALVELAGVVAMADEVGMPEDQIPGTKVFTLSNAATIALHHDMFDEAREILDERTRQMGIISDRVEEPDFRRRQAANIAVWEGQLAARQGSYELAAEKAEEYRSLVEPDANPRRFEAHHALLGLIALEQGDYEKAVSEFRQSNLQVEYNKYHLALALDGSGETDEAAALFKEVGQYNFNSVGFALVRKDALARGVESGG
jgi:tetratricopeptide (TPR) repeat protein